MNQIMHAIWLSQYITENSHVILCRQFKLKLHLSHPDYNSQTNQKVQDNH